MAVCLWPRVEGSRLFKHTAPNVARTQKVVLDADAIERSIRRIAVAILEATSGVEDLTLVGIRRGGDALSRRIANEIARAEGQSPPVGTIDISLYRDDAATALPLSLPGCCRYVMRGPSSPARSLQFEWPAGEINPTSYVNNMLRPAYKVQSTS